MPQVFWGILFLFLNVNLTFGSVTIGLFPDFVGYLLLLQGARTLAGRIARFSRLEPLCVGGAAYTGVLYLLNLFGVSTGLGWVVYCASWRARGSWAGWRTRNAPMGAVLRRRSSGRRGSFPASWAR